MRGGFWFLISRDSAILRFATSVHTLSIEILNTVAVILHVGCFSATWSPKGVFLVKNKTKTLSPSIYQV